MVSAVFPNCRILLVEANSAGAGDLMSGIETAVALGAKFISNSHGTDERDALSEFGARLDQPGIAINGVP
jgi:hypothetical protein